KPIVVLHLGRSYRTFFFFSATATTEIYTLSLHDALPIFTVFAGPAIGLTFIMITAATLVLDLERPERFYYILTRPNWRSWMVWGDRKSTRLNSSHVAISYAVFCLKKKTK